jgi:hypothetical protein
VEPRSLRIGSLFEWITAALCVLALIWVGSVPLQRLLGPDAEASPIATPSSLPPGVPHGAISIPVLLLLDGRAIRVGDSQAHVNTVVPDTYLHGPILKSNAVFGERHTRTYIVNGTTFYVACERQESGGVMQVTGIYVP